MTTIKAYSVCLPNLLVVLLAAGLTNCGSSQASTKKTSGLKKRVLVSNTMGNVHLERDPVDLHLRLVPGNGSVDIMDASKDTFVSRDNAFSDLFPALSVPATGA